MGNLNVTSVSQTTIFDVLKSDFTNTNINTNDTMIINNQTNYENIEINENNNNNSNNNNNNNNNIKMEQKQDIINRQSMSSNASENANLKQQT